MKLNRVGPILCLTAIVALLASAPFWRRPGASTPTLQFVEFRTADYGARVAAFRAENPSDQSFSYLAYGATSAASLVSRTATPIALYRVPVGTGWRMEGPDNVCRMGVGYRELAPHSSVEFEIEPPRISPQFAVGVHFEPATPLQLTSRPDTRWEELRYRIRSWFPEPEPTWSAVVP